MAAEDNAAKYEGYANGEVLVTPQWLEEHLSDPAVRVIEVDVSPAAYDAGHIDGAVLWNVYSNWTATTSSPTGRRSKNSWPVPESARTRPWFSTATHPPWACG